MGECNSNRQVFMDMRIKTLSLYAQLPRKKKILNLNIYSPTPVCFYFESRLIINEVEKKVVFFCLICPTGEIWSELLHRKTKAETV